jgi:hypothetical protein
MTVFLSTKVVSIELIGNHLSIIFLSKPLFIGYSNFMRHSRAL